MRCIYDTQTQWYFITQFNVVDVNRYAKYCSNYSNGRVTIDNNVNEVISCKPYSKVLKKINEVVARGLCIT